MKFPATLAPRPLILLGAGGHARVLLALAKAAGLPMLGVCDPALKAAGHSHWEGLAVLGGDEAVSRYKPSEVHLLLGLGQVVQSNARAQLYANWRAKGYAFPPVVHPAAWVAAGVQMADGVQVMAGALLQPGCQIGANTIVNTRASVDHDCRIGADVHIAPGATVCGGVEVGDGVFVGAGAVLIQGLRVGPNAIIGAGVTLVRDLAPHATVVGAANRLRSQLTRSMSPANVLSTTPPPQT